VAVWLASNNETKASAFRDDALPTATTDDAAGAGREAGGGAPTTITASFVGC